MSKDCCSTDTPSKNKSGSSDPGKGVRSVFKVSGMDCADEVAAVQNSLRIEGVHSVDANIMNETVTVFHEDALEDKKISSLIEKAGLKVVTVEKKSFFQDHRRRIFLVGASGVALAIGLVFDQITSENSLLTIGLYFISIILSGTIIFPKAFRSIAKFHLDMNVLMTVAVIGAVAIKEYSEAASVVFLFSLAELLEAMSVSRARKAIQEVLKITPKEAILVKENGETENVQVTALKIADLILVRPGDNIATDGTIEEGQSAVNQASLTGESLPVDKKKGDTVFAGTINESGALKIRVSKAFSDSKISKVISMIEDAQKEKAPSQRFVDKFASIYTPSVMAFAVLIAVLPPLLNSGSWNEWIYKALVFIVIGCPCALVIATPVSVVSGLTSLAKRGILIKGGVHLESLGKLKAIALDKTGTLTEGKPEVTSYKLFSNVSEKDAIFLAASLESMSSHPLALAMLNYAKSKQISLSHPKDFKIITGKGAEGVIDGHPYFVGNHNLGHELGVCSPEIEAYLNTAEMDSKSVIVLGHKPHSDCKGEIIAVFSLGDKIRNNISSAIADFHSAGVKNVTMLSGDNQKTVNAVAKQVGIDDAKGGLLPEDKVSEIKQLVQKYKFVGMVGDGVNDAPALANATVGIAMGVVGSDTALETADVALMKDDIFMLPKAIKHGRQVLNIIRFNIGFAIAIKAVFFVLAFLGMTNLWLAVAADMGASLLVTFNALRLLRIRD